MTTEELIHEIGKPNLHYKTDNDYQIGYQTGGPNDAVYKIWLEDNRVMKEFRYDGYATPIQIGDQKYILAK